MNKKHSLWISISAGLLLQQGLMHASYANGPMRGSAVEVMVIGDQNGAAAEYPVADSNPFTYRAYIQATPNERYSVQVTNNSNRRIGIVLAVDGRNAISGARSDLAANERMYILQPHETQAYEGWRTGQNRTNRFFFTDSANSYAASWGDQSAMGVIAVAAYPEYEPPHYHRAPPPMSSDRNMESAQPSARSAGTGYGETTYSPSERVDFIPQHQPMSRQFLKYEWKSSLCEKHILPAEQCYRPRPHEERNRFWPSRDGYAPPPRH